MQNYIQVVVFCKRLHCRSPILVVRMLLEMGTGHLLTSDMIGGVQLGEAGRGGIDYVGITMKIESEPQNNS